MAARRRESALREQVRGVGIVVLMGAGVCLVGLLVIVVFVWWLT